MKISSMMFTDLILLINQNRVSKNHIGNSFWDGFKIDMTEQLYSSSIYL